MKIFDCATENIKVGGKRRVANMAVLRVDHPDIEQFVSAKRDGVSLENFNLSVGITDEFMEAVEAGRDFALRHPADGRELRRQPARTLFSNICEAACATGDPGLVFLDAIARANPTPAIGQIECTNPCGEVPLLPYEACNLGSINLVHFIGDRNGQPAVDYDRLKDLVHAAVRFLDDRCALSIHRGQGCNLRRCSWRIDKLTQRWPSGLAASDTIRLQADTPTTQLVDPCVGVSNSRSMS